MVAGIGSVALGGSTSTARAALLGVLVGAPMPIVELANGGQAASIVALVLALAATTISSFALRAMGRDG